MEIANSGVFFRLLKSGGRFNNTRGAFFRPRLPTWNVMKLKPPNYPTLPLIIIVKGERRSRTESSSSSGEDPYPGQYQSNVRV